MKRGRVAAALVLTTLVGASICAVAISSSFDAAVLKLKEGKDAEAIPALRLLSSIGHGKAQFLLGEAHAYGRGVQKERETALIWFRRAGRHAEGLNDPAAYAAYYVGKSYRDGEGITKDPEEAKFWFEVAARGGYRP